MALRPTCEGGTEDLFQIGVILVSKKSKDLLLSIICILFSLIFMAVVIPHEIPLPRFSSGGTTPRTIPKICCWIILSMSVIIMVRTFLADKHCFSLMFKDLSTVLQNRKGWRTFGYVVAVFCLSVLYYIGYSNIGFIITTLVLFPAYAFVLGCRKPITILITDVVLTFGVYYFFAALLHCYLPGWAPFII